MDWYEILGIEPESVFTETGDPWDAWRNEVLVDLVELAGGNPGAFSVVEDIPPSAGISMRQYHGLSVAGRMPHGATAEGVVELCEEIWARLDDLTAGFSAGWDGSNFVGCWACDDPESDSDTWDAASAAKEFWKDFQSRVDEIGAVEVYDLAYSENLPFVLEALQASGYKPSALRTRAAAEAALEEVYPPYGPGDDVYTIGYAHSARQVAEWAAEEEEEEEEEDAA